MGRSLAELPRLLSRPADVWWAGFRSTTLELQQCGWDIAANEDVRRGTLALLLRNRGFGLHAFTEAIRFPYMNYPRHEMHDLAFRVISCVPADQKIMIARSLGIPMPLEGYRQVDAMTQLTTSEIKSIDDLRIFAAPLARTEEIIVEPQTVASLLEQIRKMQAPEQARIRAKERLAARRQEMEVGPRQTFHAQIISLDEHREAA